MRNKNFFQAFKHALDGIQIGFKTQRNLRFHLAAAILAIVLGLILELQRFEMLFLILSIAFVIFAEMMNTAIEAVVDLVTEEYHELAKMAKDVAAGAVVIASINAIIVAIVIAYELIKKLI